MKFANTALLTILNSGNGQFIYADLWKIALRTGLTLYYTDWGANVTQGGVTYLSTTSLVSESKYKLQRGLAVDECDLTMNPSSNDSVGGVSFIKAVTNGMFDRAVVTKYRQFMSAAEAQKVPVVNPAANALLLFLGEISDWEMTNMAIDFKIKSMLNLLNIQMPRRQYQPTCGFVFGDSNCTKNRSALVVSGSATLASTSSTIITGLTNTAGYFNNGVLTFTSGANVGVIRTVKSYQNGTFTLVAPFPNPVSVGDSFSATPGCNKNYAGVITNVNAAALVGSTVTTIYNTLKYASGYFNGGTLQFTSGANAGQSRAVSSWQTGAAYLSSGFSAAPAVGDSFTITASSSNTSGSCTGNANTAHFGGMPYVPVPESAY